MNVSNERKQVELFRSVDQNTTLAIFFFIILCDAKVKGMSPQNKSCEGSDAQTDAQTDKSSLVYQTQEETTLKAKTTSMGVLSAFLEDTAL